MSVFADSSALVKLYADEEGHATIRNLGSLVVSQVARVEVPAALWRKHRMRELGPEDTQVLTAAFEADYFGTEDEEPRFAAIRILDHILDEATQLCATHSLRAYDGVQLASALAARRADAGCGGFAAFDRDLRGAAASAGFELVPQVTS